MKSFGALFDHECPYKPYPPQNLVLYTLTTGPGINCILGQPKLIKIFASTHSAGKNARARNGIVLLCYRVMSLLIEMRIPETYLYVDVIQYHGVFGV